MLLTGDSIPLTILGCIPPLSALRTINLDQQCFSFLFFPLIHIRRTLFIRIQFPITNSLFSSSRTRILRVEKILMPGMPGVLFRLSNHWSGQCDSTPESFFPNLCSNLPIDHYHFFSFVLHFPCIITKP